MKNRKPSEEKEVTQLKAELTELKEEFEKIEARVSQEIAEKEVIIVTSNHKIASLERLYDNLKDDYNHLKREYQTKTEQNFELTMRLNSQVSEEDKNVDNNENCVESDNELIFEQQNKIEELTQQLYTARNIIGLKNKTIKCLKEQYNEEVEKVGRKIEEYNFMVAELKRRLES